MAGRFLLLVSCIICYLRFHYMKSQQPDIHTSFKTWCPHSSFCDQEHSIPVRQTLKEDSVENTEPCCSSCSCSKNCGRTRNCCKYEYDLYRLDETLDTICKQLTISPSGREVPGLPYYHIIDKCPNRSEICRSIDDETYRPVYAKDSKMLYYNEKCASCHSQEDLTRFTSLLACEHQFVSPFDSLRYKNKGKVSSGCVLNWIPTDELDLSTEICYPYIVNKCSRIYDFSDSFDILCDSFNATFRKGDIAVYSNVFCFLCSNPKLDTYDSHKINNLMTDLQFCPTDNQYRGTSKKPFIIMLDSTQTSTPSNVETGKPETTPVWCKSVAGKVNCRPVFCPEGQMYVGGKCQMFGKQWYFRMMRINVKLTIPIGHENVIPKVPLSSSGSFDRIYLRRPGLQDSQLTLSYNIDTDNVTIRFFLAMLYYEKKSIQPIKLMNKMEIALGTHWKLFWHHKEYTLVPKLNQYLRYTVAVSDVNMAVVLRNEQQTTREQIRFIAGHKSVYELEGDKESFFLSKLFLCSLVELNEGEYEDHVGRLTLHNGSKYLEDGEFTWAHITDEEHRPLICLHDLPGYSNSSNGKQTKMYLWLIGAEIFVFLMCPKSSYYVNFNFNKWAN